MKVAPSLFCAAFLLGSSLSAAPAMQAANAAAPPALATALAFSTYLPNRLGRIFSAAAVAVDRSGSLYVTGATAAPFDNFPFPGPQTPFVMKLSPQGEVLYTTIFPGTGTSSATAIAVNDRGEVAIAGYAAGNLPQIGGLAPAFRGSGYEAFTAKLGAGGEILYSTTLGGAHRELAWGVDMDPNGAIYVTGETGSPDFPQVGPLPLPRGAAEDVFLVKLVPGSPQPAWSLAFGGAERDQPEDLAVDAAGRSYLTGYTVSADFPTVNALQPEHAGGLDAFAVSLGAGGGQAIYSTFLGGSGDDSGLGLDLGAAGVAWIGGLTGSDDFPLADPFQAALQGGHADGFVAGLSAAGALVFATYLGGAGIDYVTDLAVGRSGL
ncbi:MAG TPA: SBBP repeat-containing protein, partial [Thermoanaerobaculia bacterium]|nr:SBBP repeat-containing protein [Thermoanaerobaculia bacterium]